MKALVEEVNTVQRRIKVEVTANDVKSAFDSAYRNLQKKARINGFRPGKAPMNVIRKFYGGSVAYDVADQLVRSHLFPAIEKEALNPIAAPVLETMDLPKENSDYSFSALVDILPPLKVEGYKGLDLNVSTVDPGAGDLERELEFIQRRHAKTKEAAADASAQGGHVVTISQNAEIEGELFPEFSFEKVPVELGKKYLLPELEDGLIGMKVGEQKTIEILVPEHVQDKSKVGKKAQATVKLDAIQEVSMPEINDELAKDMGLEDLPALKANIQDRLARQAESFRRNQLETAIFEQMSEKNQFDVPPSMVDQVIDSMFDEMEFSSDKERKAAKGNAEERRRLRDTAKQRAKNTLILSEIIKGEKIQVNDADFDSYVNELIAGSGMGQAPDPKLLESIKASLGPHARESLLFKKALDFIIDHAKITEKKESAKPSV